MVKKKKIPRQPAGIFFSTHNLFQSIDPKCAQKKNTGVGGGGGGRWKMEKKIVQGNFFFFCVHN